MLIKSVRLLTIGVGCWVLAGCYENSASKNSSAASDQRAVEKYTAELERQAKEAADQQLRFAKQLDVSDLQLSKIGEQNKRYDELLKKWEEQSRRFDAVLDRWERLVPPSEPK